MRAWAMHEGAVGIVYLRNLEFFTNNSSLSLRFEEYADRHNNYR